MSPLLRGGLAVAGLAGAFAAGFFLKPFPSARTIAAQPPAESRRPKHAPAGPAVDVPAIVPPAPDLSPRSASRRSRTQR